MRISKITMARLYNLGSYEHVRYELTADIGNDESAAQAFIGMERLMAALAPESKACLHSQGEIDREANKLRELAADATLLPEEEFQRKHGHFQEEVAEYVARCTKSHLENAKKRAQWLQRAKKARELLDSLGGAADWKDAKLDWDDYSGD